MSNPRKIDSEQRLVEAKALAATLAKATENDDPATSATALIIMRLLDDVSCSTDKNE